MITLFDKGNRKIWSYYTLVLDKPDKRTNTLTNLIYTSR